MAVMGSQVRRLRSRHSFKIIGVVGSIGKTSTKLAIAKMLQASKRVRYQEGNYNDIISVPLVFFGHKMPPLWNIFLWLKIIFLNEMQIWANYPFDMAVIELGTDAPGQILEFRKYLHLDIAVVTAIAPEHMEFFENLNNVADEEWSVSFFSDIVFANKDLCVIVPSNLNNKKIIYYGKEYGSVYKIENIERLKNGFSFDLSFEGQKFISTSYGAISEVQLYSVCAAAAVAKACGFYDEKIKEAIPNIHSFSGRMQKLVGIKNSLIIDDSYNASPDAVKMALVTLYSFPASQRVAILGMMNELGKSFREEHEKIGRFCNSEFLDFVVTVGKDANAYLAPVAKMNGCEVFAAQNSLEAGNIVKDKIKEGAVVLAKGSQNGVFVEEAIKPLLKNKSDFSKLVRQDKNWINKKRLTFGQDPL